MKVLAVVSQKGGVGKTTVALNTAFALATRGWRVALIDTDPQGAVGLSLAKEGTGAGLAGCVVQGLDLADVKLRTRLAQLDIVPMGDVAVQDTHELGNRLADGRELARLLEPVADQYDVVVFDTPSGFGGITLGVLRVADYAISPLQAEPIAMRSLPQLLEVLAALRADGARVQLAGIVLSMLQLRVAESFAVANEAWAALPEAVVLKTTIPRDPALLRASAAGAPVGLVSRRPPAVAAVFEQLAVELEEKLGLEEPGEDGPLALLA